MIRNFWVTNFLSIRDKQELNFIAKGPKSQIISEMAPGDFVYKLAILLGPNASGKSNILLALNALFRLLVQPESDAQETIKAYMPFETMKDQPTVMHASFYADGIRYDYEIAFTKGHVISETMSYYPNRSKALFYERKFVGEGIQSDIKFGPNLKLTSKTQDTIREHTLNNHSVLSVCRKISMKEDIAPFTKLHGWIMANYHEVDGDKSTDIIDTLTNTQSDPRKYKFYLTLLKKADLNIIDFHPVEKIKNIPPNVKEEILKSELPMEVKEKILDPIVKTINFTHASEDGTFEVPLGWQSKGTIAYIKILEALYDLTSGNHVYYLDELGEDLHYDLLRYYLSVFLYNSDKSQLIITSQESLLLKDDIINDNRGLAWLVEKNRETASSEYSRADTYGLHKNLSLFNSYMIGRMGAKPELNSFFIDMED